jgi:hypothetical protein
MVHAVAGGETELTTDTQPLRGPLRKRESHLWTHATLEDTQWFIRLKV